MPIVVKDYTWTQTEKMIHIRIALKPGYRQEVDLFSSDEYLRATFSPFIFEVFLLHEIENEKSVCLIQNDLIVFDLVKKEEKEWMSLEKELTKPEKMQLKQEVLDKSVKDAQEKAEDRRIKRTQLDRFTVQQAMAIDTQQHTLMDSRRDEARNNAMDALEQWRIHTVERDIPPLENQNSGVIITELSSSDEEKAKPEIKPTLRKKSSKTMVKSEYVEKKKTEAAKRVLPKMRSTAELEIHHTPRTFPTPSRESTANEEQAWLKNITMARRATGFVSEDLRPEEHDPQWCKEKGDEFFRNGNFLGAISAYTHGITLSDKLPSLFSNRAATHFALGNFNKCVNDCSTALDLMKPPCEGNRHSRAKCIARRAAAMARIGYLNKAIDEMKAASKLLPDDEGIKKDIYDMERAWEQNPDSD